MGRRDPEPLLAMALSRPQDALRAAREALSRDPPPDEASVAHQTVGIVLRDFGDIRQAVAELRTAHRLALRTGDQDRAAETRSSLGVALVHAGDHRRGLAALEAAATGSSGIVAGRILVRRANALWVLGRNREALADARRAVALLSGVDDPVWQARALQHRAAVHLALGDVERADLDYARCEQLYAACGQQLEYASARQERGMATLARGDLPAALAYLDDARDRFAEVGVLAPELVADRCAALVAAGLAAEAVREVDAATTRLEGQRGSATRRAELLHAAAVAAEAAGDPAGGERRAAQALRLFRAQQRTAWAARTELVIVRCRWACAGARSPGLLRRALRAAAPLDELDPDRAVGAHLLVGRIALARGIGPTGRAHLELAARARRRGRLQSRGTGWLAQALLLEAAGEWRAMLAACSHGLHLLDLHRRTLGATELRTLATAQGAEFAGLALRHAVRRGDGALLLTWSERWRATALGQVPVRPPPDSAVVADLVALRNVVQRLEGDARLRSARTGLHHERTRLEAAVRQQMRHASGPAPAADTTRFRRRELLDELGDGALIELVEVDGHLHAVLAAGGRLRLFPVGPAGTAVRTVAHALFALRREGSGRGTVRLDLGGIGTRLEAALLGDGARRLPHGPVVVVPTGRLHAVPWGLLPGLRDRPVSVTPSASLWLRARRTPAPHDLRVVLVGGPGLSTGAEEVNLLARRYPDAVVLAAGEATVEAVLAAMDGAWLVHIAAHGTFRADSPQFSAVELADGPLTVYDLERLRRAPYRVVLSSCSSAVGVPAGADEILGVVSALLALGSAGVVASVVPVDDPGTVPLMDDLHRHLREGATVARALALASAAARDDPRAWATAASFIALGS